MAIMDHQPEIEEKRLEDVESLEESVKIVAARRLKRGLGSSFDSESKTAAAEEPPTTKISANQKDVDLIKPKPQPQPQLRRNVREPTLKPNLDLLNKYPNSYFMDVRCQGAGCFFVTTIYSHSEEYQICPNCCLVWCIPSKTPGDPGTLTKKCIFWRRTENLFFDYYYGPLPPN